MKIINFKQNTPEWYEYRKTHMGASDFAYYMCLKGYSEKPSWNLEPINTYIFNKKNSVLTSNKYMEYGTNREQFLLNMFNKKHKSLCESLVIEDEENQYICASLDGYCFFDNIAVEIKTTKKPLSKKYELLDYYSWQLIQQMYIARLDKMYLFIEFRDSKDVVIDIQEYIMKHTKFENKLSYILFDDKEHPIIIKTITIDEMVAIRQEFLDLLHKVQDEEILPFLQEYINLNQQIKELTELKNIAVEKIKHQLPNGGIVSNFVINHTKSATTKIDYEAVIKDNNINIDNKYIIEKVNERYYIAEKNIK